MDQVIEVVVDAVLSEAIPQSFGKFPNCHLSIRQRVLVFVAMLLAFLCLNYAVAHGEGVFLRVSRRCPILPEREPLVHSQLLRSL